jgi:DNA-directed RNA polymerase subunit omega
MTFLEKMSENSGDQASLALHKRRISGFTPSPLPSTEFILSEKTLPQVPENIVSFEQTRPNSQLPGSTMKSDLVEQASEIVSDPLVLINLVSQRVRQLNSGRSPLIATVPSMGAADIALTEIIEGKLKLVDKGSV